MASTNKVTGESVEAGEHINYTDENNWTLEEFVSHHLDRMQIKLDKKTINIRGYFLKVRWKGYPLEDDSIEPIHFAAEHHMTALLKYLQKVQDKNIFQYIAAKPAGHFSTSFKHEVQKLLQKIAVSKTIKMRNKIN